MVRVKNYQNRPTFHEIVKKKWHVIFDTRLNSKTNMPLPIKIGTVVRRIVAFCAMRLAICHRKNLPSFLFVTFSQLFSRKHLPPPVNGVDAPD